MRYFPNQYKDVPSGSVVQVDKAKWLKSIETTVNTITSKMAPSSFENCDGGLYVGNAGIAYMMYRLSRSEVLSPEQRQNYSQLSCQYLETSLAFCRSKSDRDPEMSFLLGKAGVYAVGTAIFAQTGDNDQAVKLTKEYNSIGNLCKTLKIYPYGSDELFVGRAGYLAGSLFINDTLGKQVNKNVVCVCVCFQYYQNLFIYLKFKKKFVLKKINNLLLSMPLVLNTKKMFFKESRKNLVSYTTYI